jgi:uncharacterized protein (TIGR02597 family)
MKSLKFLATFTAMALSSAMAATTDPVGFVSVPVQANSDAILAVPLNRASEFKGVINSIVGNEITVSGTPNWNVNQFVQNGGVQPKTYALQIASGAKEGLIGKVTANTANSVTVQLDSGEDLSGVVSGANGDQIDILPYWTPASLISASTVTPNSQILLLASTLAGINQSSSGALLFDAGNWYDDNFENADNFPLPFGSAFIYRNGTSAATISLTGSVPMNKHRTVIRTRASNVDQDIAIGFMSPVPTPVGSLGLGFVDDDQILIFNNTAAGINKSSTGALIYTTADGWVDDNFTPVGTTFMLQPGQGYIFRKKGTSLPQTIVWTSLQTYLQ